MERINKEAHSGMEKEKEKETVQDLSLISDQHNCIKWKCNSLKYKTLERARVGGVVVRACKKITTSLT